MCRSCLAPFSTGRWQRVQHLDGAEHLCSVRLDNTSVHDHLIQDEVRAVEVEHDVQLAHGPKVAVQRLYESVHQLQRYAARVSDALPKSRLEPPSSHLPGSSRPRPHPQARTATRIAYILPAHACGN